MKDATSILLYFTYSLHFLNLFLDSTSFRKHRKPSGLERERRQRQRLCHRKLCGLLQHGHFPLSPGQTRRGPSWLFTWRSWWFERLAWLLVVSPTDVPLGNCQSNQQIFLPNKFSSLAPWPQKGAVFFGLQRVRW